MLSAMLRTLDLRDQMTARHSAAVARYSRAIAQRAGYSRREEELVHIAALLHDIGKFILPDRILKANVPLTDEDWMLIKRHPQQGARVVSSLDGYGPVAEIILAHHERIDGKGYPRGLAGDDIPELARIISVADTYDVMTARDSYRTPMSSSRRDRRSCAALPASSSTPASSRSSSSCSRARTSPSSTARLPTSRRSWRWKRGSQRPPARVGEQRPLPGRGGVQRSVALGSVARDARRHLPGPRRGPGRGEARPRADGSR